MAIWCDIIHQIADMADTLGEGTFGRVHRVRLADGTEVAHKVYKSDRYLGVSQDAIHELAALARCPRHPHVIEAIDIQWTDAGVVLVMPVAVHGDLTKFRLHDIQAQSDLLKGVVAGIAHIHAHGMMHRDLSPRNVLVFGRAPELVARVADLGSCRLHVPGRCNSLETCTMWYKAPEMIMGGAYYDKRVDVWSIGIIALELAQGRAPCRGMNDHDQMLEYIALCGTPEPSMCPTVNSMTTFDPAWPKSEGRGWKIDHRSVQQLTERALVYDPRNRAVCSELLLIFDANAQAPVDVAHPPWKPLFHLDAKDLDARVINIDWMCETAHANRVTHYALHTAVSLLDKFSHTSTIVRMVHGVAMLWMGVKLDMDPWFDTYDAKAFCHGMFTSAEIIEAERQVLKAIGFDLWIPPRVVPTRPAKELIHADLSLFLYPPRHVPVRVYAALAAGVVDDQDAADVRACSVDPRITGVFRAYNAIKPANPLPCMFA